MGGAVWTFLASPGHQQGVAGSGSESTPPSSCRLISVSWPLRFSDTERKGLVPPPHFCAYIASTLLGAEFLRQAHFVNIKIKEQLRRATMGESGNSVVLDARAALWAAGHLGRMPFGLDLLLHSDVLPSIVALASQASRCSLRGTAIYCLALIGSNPLAADHLAELDWDVSLLGPCAIDGLAAERVLAPWLGVNSTEGLTALVVQGPGPPSVRNIEAEDRCITGNVADLPSANFGALHRRALEDLKSLQNTVVQKKAVKALNDLRHQQSSTFLSVQLWWSTQKFIGSHGRYPLQVRRFISELFSETLRSRESLQLLDRIPLDVLPV